MPPDVRGVMLACCIARQRIGRHPSVRRRIEGLQIESANMSAAGPLADIPFASAAVRRRQQRGHLGRAPALFKIQSMTAAALQGRDESRSADNPRKLDARNDDDS
jgi:hypothetical protein